ncbi:MAG: excinuclease ABC subunit UvrA [Chlamydiales bacterium]|nr:excinuclease ABC subunit UvrA [Chlamydiales bacterium]
MQSRPITLKNVCVHNLRSISLSLEPNQLIVFTGVSGSGKSSLAFDTIFVEGQRRYVESLSTFARRYLGDLAKPDLEHAYNLSPTISIEQKTAGKNPRSTVGTMTEIYDYLRVLFARVAKGFCPISNTPVALQSKERIIKSVQALPQGKKILILAPLAKGKKAGFAEDLQMLQKKGFLRARIDGKIELLDQEITLDTSLSHDIDVVIDRIEVSTENFSRLAEAVTSALEMGKGLCSVLDVESEKETLFSMHAYSQSSGISYAALEPHDFSFNSPHGMCTRCHGLGKVEDFDLNLIIDEDKSIQEDCCSIASSYATVRYGNIYDNLARLYKFNVKTPWKMLSEQAKNVFLYGNDQKWTSMRFTHPIKKNTWTEYVSWKGVLSDAKTRLADAKSALYQSKMQKLMHQEICPACKGSRLKPYPSKALLAEKSIQQITALSIKNCLDFFENIKLSKEEEIIACELLKEIKQRLYFLMDVGLHYLCLNRESPTLSGGEAQRVRLASQIGSGLVGVTYILDEPSIGLHPRDNTRLVQTLRHLQGKGNTVIVVEHDEETILHADHVVDFGPGPGVKGGEVIFEGPVKDLLKHPSSLTGKYLSGRLQIAIPKKRKKPSKDCIKILGASHNNLKSIDLEVPLGLFVAITGVSGSGKSSLISDILYPLLANSLHKAELPVGKYKELLGIEKIDKVIAIDQTPIGRIPRSNPATYIKVFDEIRDLFSMLPESLAKGYKPGQFSFNVKQGSCTNCSGMGLIKIDMDFMEDAWVTCEICKGNRFDEETLSVKFKGKSINDVLQMSVLDAHAFFSAIPKIAHQLEMLIKVGMGYIQLGQPSTTLSGGEAQRIKLAKELIRPSTGKTLYILDEPTTGLHFHDIAELLKVLHTLVDRGNTVVVIEHNMDVVKTADWIIDMGPEGGDDGGKIVAKGTPEQISLLKTPTGHALSVALNNSYLELVAKEKKKKNKKDAIIQNITVMDAETHNLKRVCATIPREKITICTGPSGSGKSSLAFDTIYAEGQRRYTESLSPYARQFVEQMPKPKVGSVEGLSPSVAIEQKAHAGNPRSTVGTLTEIYDYLRLLFARSGIAYCPETKERICSISKEFIVEKILLFPEGTPIYILAPIEITSSESFEEVQEKLARKGFLRIYLNGSFFELDEKIPYIRGRKNKLFLVVDRLKVSSNIKSRLFEAISTAAEISCEKVSLIKDNEEIHFNLSFSVESTGKSYPPITPQSFAFNTHSGMCLDCLGLGTQYGANLAKFPDIMQLNVTGLLNLVWNKGKSRNIYKIIHEMKAFFEEEKISLEDPLSDLPPEKLQLLMNGSPPEKWYETKSGFSYQWRGINPVFAKAGHKAHFFIKEKIIPWLHEMVCPSCKGSRLNPLASHVEVHGKTMHEVCSLPILSLLSFLQTITLSKEQSTLLEEVLKQLINRLNFLIEVGLHYISLDRTAPTLSNGEAQRIRLARQLGSGLTGILYVLDEPTVGLHPKEIELLNNCLKKLKDLGNTLLLVEHDPMTLSLADYIIDMGPKAGSEGGHIVARGTLEEIKNNPNSLTGAYLSGKNSVAVPKTRRYAKSGSLFIKNATMHNLKNISLELPIGLLTCITGVSGSGKSTLIHDFLHPLVQRGVGRKDALSSDDGSISGLNHFDKVIMIDQNPIGHTVRSNVVTYVEALTCLREFFAKIPKAKAMGLQPKHFSYNHRAGMCTGCQGLGYKKIEMHFLPPVVITCPDCKGLRLNPRSLEVLYMEKTFGNILQMTIKDALVLFAAHPKIKRIFETLSSVGLGYLQLGQEIATLSGGEAQRLKLSRELAKRSTGKTLYLLDEPTTGLHADDINKLVSVLQRLVDKGNTMIVIEHQLDLIRSSDYIIDLGPKAGSEGGFVVATGTPEAIAKNKHSITGPYL